MLCNSIRAEFTKSLEQFQALQTQDQYRLTNMDVFSHILFVKVGSTRPLAACMCCDTADTCVCDSPNLTFSVFTFS